MKNMLLVILFCTVPITLLYAQSATDFLEVEKDIEALIGKYAQARETKDTILLKSILTNDIDQLVSTGEWRRGMEGAMQGMMQSSKSKPGQRTLIVDNIRLINPESAIVDARYEIENTDGTVRKMWSTFLVVNQAGTWKITAIRNMLPKGYS